MEFKQTIGYVLHELAHSIDAASDQVLLERCDIGFAQFKLLLVLEEQDGIVQKEVAFRLNQTEASISRQIGILQQKRLVIVRFGANDKRARRIFLSDKGADVAVRAKQVLNARHSHVFEAISETEQIKLVSSLKKIQAFFV